MLVVVLNDGETYTSLSGCKIIDVNSIRNDDGECVRCGHMEPGDPEQCSNCDATLDTAADAAVMAAYNDEGGSSRVLAELSEPAPDGDKALVNVRHGENLEIVVWAGARAPAMRWD